MQLQRQTSGSVSIRKEQAGPVLPQCDPCFGGGFDGLGEFDSLYVIGRNVAVLAHSLVITEPSSTTM